MGHLLCARWVKTGSNDPAVHQGAGPRIFSLLPLSRDRLFPFVLRIEVCSWSPAFVPIVGFGRYDFRPCGISALFFFFNFFFIVFFPF